MVFMFILFCLVGITIVMYTMCGEGDVGCKSEVAGEIIDNGCKYYKKKITNDATSLKFQSVTLLLQSL